MVGELFLKIETSHDKAFEDNQDINEVSEKTEEVSEKTLEVDLATELMEALATQDMGKEQTAEVIKKIMITL